MTVYVIRDGVVVEKASLAEARDDTASIFPSPRVSRMEPFASPVTGKDITTWRERDRDMQAANAYDPRDLRKDHVYRRGRQVQSEEAKNGRPGTDGTVWRDPAASA